MNAHEQGVSDARASVEDALESGVPIHGMLSVVEEVRAGKISPPSATLIEVEGEPNWATRAWCRVYDAAYLAEVERLARGMQS